MWAAQVVLVERTTRQLPADSVQKERLITLPDSRSGCVTESSHTGSLRLKFPILSRWFEQDTWYTGDWRHPQARCKAFKGRFEDEGGGGDEEGAGLPDWGDHCLDSPVFSQYYVPGSLHAFWGSCLYFAGLVSSLSSTPHATRTAFKLYPYVRVPLPTDCM